ncbi:MAG: 3-phosphoshikimate 1-carboxyvinyltransferase [Chloroflexi bacterium]|nr:3-phosphoshikimate 1-carboxyvinyltransferase [Chloroflexota bacterium]
MTPASIAPTIRPAAHLRGSLTLPPDKSIAHRAFMFAALASGPSAITMGEPGHDVLSTIRCLRELGVEIEETEPGRWSVSGSPMRHATLDCGNSGTTMRLLAGMLAGLPLRVTLDGDDSLRARPMERVAELLRTTGAEVTTTDGHAPITVVGRASPAATSHELAVPSAQLLGACVLAGLGAKGETQISVPGPTRDHTERMLTWLGVPIRRAGSITTLTGPARPRGFELEVPGDPSAASAWLVAAALHPDAEIRMERVGLNPTRLALVGLLQRMGVDVEMTVTEVSGPEPVGEIRVRGGRPLHAVSIGGAEVAELIDELPLVAIAMASVEEPSEVRDAGELRIKETDRISAVAEGLQRIGATVEELEDGWRVSRGTPASALIRTHGDHRIAIAFAIAATAGVAASVELDDAECAAVSYPTFWRDLAAVTA